MNWYVGDGSYGSSSKRGIKIGVVRENVRKCLPTLEEKLKDLGIECNIIYDGLRIKNSSHNRFFDYILSNGVEIPPSYEYKFPRGMN